MNNEKMRELMERAMAELGDAPEISPGNYSDDEVLKLNNAANQAYNILDAALTQQPESEPRNIILKLYPELATEFEALGWAPPGYGPQPTPQVPEGVPWSKFPAWLIDHHDGDVISEEGLQRALAAMIAAPSIAEKREWPAAAVKDVVAERRRQQIIEHWTPEHDDSYSDHQLTRAAICYADPYMDDAEMVPAIWPWEELWWKPKTRRRDLTRAAALIIAEIERLDRRNAAPPAGGE